MSKCFEIEIFKLRLSSLRAMSKPKNQEELSRCIEVLNDMISCLSCTKTDSFLKIEKRVFLKSALLLISVTKMQNYKPFTNWELFLPEIDNSYFLTTLSTILSGIDNIVKLFQNMPISDIQCEMLAKLILELKDIVIDSMSISNGEPLPIDKCLLPLYEEFYFLGDVYSPLNPNSDRIAVLVAANDIEKAKTFANEYVKNQFPNEFISPQHDITTKFYEMGTLVKLQERNSNIAEAFVAKKVAEIKGKCDNKAACVYAIFKDPETQERGCRSPLIVKCIPYTIEQLTQQLK